MPEIEWLLCWDNRDQTEQKKEIANMEADDFAVLLEEIEHH